MRSACGATLALALFMAGCADPATRYDQRHDSAPLRSITAADVADAVPRPDPILPAGNKSPYTVNGITYEVLPDARGYRERGVASWYGAKFDGFETSNGEIFDVYKASAAHRTLPIPSYARITNLDNHSSVVVRINDRGPFHAERLVDLSYGAAVKLGFAQEGTARVEVAVIDVAGSEDRRDVPLGGYRFLQIGAFGQEESARRMQAELRALTGQNVFVAPVQAGGALLYRVRVGPVEDSAQLQALQAQLRASGYDPGQPLP
ncbi:MAG: septal ring lytic transglycosylase RlpA family protein [Halioglobus sp.]|nr:septal ring lytic transglycosylase RlpA family protein [Halioglobus sp.]